MPFRSVAMKLLKGLNADARKLFRLDVLRPPTFEQLSKTLRRAQQDGEPYHAVHFDGHGAFLDLAPLLNVRAEKDVPPDARRLFDDLFDPQKFSPRLLYPDPPRPGKHGYLSFENPASHYNMRFVDGAALGKLLAETGVAVLVLNACRSAHVETSPPAPLLEGEGSSDAPRPVGEGAGVRDNPHEHIRAFGSLAQEVMDAGAAGVVAMCYNVYVATAALFVAELYAALTQGQTLGAAVTAGRRHLQANPTREIDMQPLPLQDWIVPVVYEAAPLPLFPKPAQAGRLRIALDDRAAMPTAGVLDADLPGEPDVGFYGRDETLLAIERAFDTQPIVLLHAYAGSGKTTTVAEFARWYVLTGGAAVALFSSFERHLPLARALAKFEPVFGGMLEQNGIHWLTLTIEQQRQVALQIMQQKPILWIWDNVEAVAGFPSGTPSMWSEPEQRELVEFLRAARQTGAKFLLTSRRDEQAWLRDLPRRVAMPDMPMRERVALARAIADKHGERLTDPTLWLPLLRFTQGNPLTITVAMGQALREIRASNFRSLADFGSFITKFVDKLRAGEAAFDDDANEERSKSLGASLQYGFAQAFTAEERRQLALLHLFQGFVDVKALVLMEKDLRGLEDLGGLWEAWIALLDRAAEIGLLTAHGGGYYSIHPALPWFFKELFERHYQPTPGVSDDGKPTTCPSQEGSSSAFPSWEGLGVGSQGVGKAALRAFVEAMGALGDYYLHKYNQGNSGVIHAIAAEEANLLHARRLARQQGWWLAVLQTMQGLRQLYDQTGRRAEWARLVAEIVSEFVDPATEEPLPGREEQWGLVTEYRVCLIKEMRDWAEAERLQRLNVAWDRRRAEAVEPSEVSETSEGSTHLLRTLAASLHELAQIQREQRQKECVAAYEEALKLFDQIGDQAAAATNAINLGHAYMDLPDLRDLAQAEAWYRRSLELRDKQDHVGRGQCFITLGKVAYERFSDACAAQQPEADLLRHLNDALANYKQALDLLPEHAVNDLALTHNAFGVIYMYAGDLDRALFHCREAIRYCEHAENFYEAGRCRYYVAVTLMQAGRLDEAYTYAEAALRNFATFGDRAAEMIQQTQRLLEIIKQAMQ